MVKSAKIQQEYDEYDDDNDESSIKARVDAQSGDQKAGTPRSKHSATEQRRRSKINERFQILRDLIPQNDQKRDKASFLLEVIEYIQFLHDRLNIYEGSYQGWSQEPTKLMPWRNNHGPIESFIDHSQVIKNDPDRESSVLVAPVLTNAQNSIESPLGQGIQASPMNISSGSGWCGVHNHSPHGSMPDADRMWQSRRGSTESALPSTLISDAEKMWQARQHPTERAGPSNTLNEQEELAIESGRVSISSFYSQGLLNNLTQALQSSGVDLSRASISVQVDVGKRAHGGLTAIGTSTKDHENPSPINQRMPYFGVGSSGQDSDQTHKRFRTENSWCMASTP